MCNINKNQFQALHVEVMLVILQIVINSFLPCHYLSQLVKVQISRTLETAAPAAHPPRFLQVCVLPDKNKFFQTTVENILVLLAVHSTVRPPVCLRFLFVAFHKGGAVAVAYWKYSKIRTILHDRFIFCNMFEIFF